MAGSLRFGAKARVPVQPAHSSNLAAESSELVLGPDAAGDSGDLWQAATL